VNFRGGGGAHAPSKSATDNASKAPDISHMDVLYDEIDDITLSQVCQAMENEHSALEGLNFMTLTQTVQSYKSNIFLESAPIDFVNENSARTAGKAS
jgi:hypothetical protein